MAHPDYLVLSGVGQEGLLEAPSNWIIIPAINYKEMKYQVMRAEGNGAETIVIFRKVVGPDKEVTYVVEPGAS